MTLRGASDSHIAAWGGPQVGTPWRSPTKPYHALLQVGWLVTGVVTGLAKWLPVTEESRSPRVQPHVCTQPLPLLGCQASQGDCSSNTDCPEEGSGHLARPSRATPSQKAGQGQHPPPFQCHHLFSPLAWDPSAQTLLFLDGARRKGGGGLQATPQAQTCLPTLALNVGLSGGEIGTTLS